METSKVISRDLVKLLIASAAIGFIFWLVWQSNPTACAIVMFEIPWLAGIFLAGLALGYFPVRGLAPGLTVGQRIVTATVCGTGLLALVVLLLGLAGLLGVWFLWLAMIGALAATGLVVLYRQVQRAAATERIVFETGRYWYVLLVGLVPFLVLVILSAAIPPGILWPAEGHGYDVLEYHLQVPKEWFQAGAITYLPHNVYANFPANAEMLYLLAMALKGDPWQAIYLAQSIHVAFAVLFVAAVWVFIRPAGIRAAAFATTAAGTCNWLAYLAPLAYVEMGMLAAGAVALGLILRIRDAENPVPARYAILIGLALGLSADFKYTALAMIAAPLFPVALGLFVLKMPLKKAIAATGLMLVFLAGAVSPYWVRNFVWTGNPVFPLAYCYFGGRGWDDQAARRWQEGHRPAESHRPLPKRLEQLYWAGLKNVVADRFIAEYYRNKNDFDNVEATLRPRGLRDLPTYGLALLILPWLVFLTRRQGFSDWLLLLALVIQTLVWLYATHLQARFTVPWLVVLPFLIARSADAYGRARFSIGLVLMTALLLGAVFLNFRESYHRYLSGTFRIDPHINWAGIDGAFLSGRFPGYEYLEIVNREPGRKVLLLAEARPFYIRGPVLYWTVFNRNDFAAAFTEGKVNGVKNYLAAVHPDYILVDWTEAARLSGTYGFEDCITPTLVNNLSSYGRFRVRSVEKWGPYFVYRQKWPVPAKTLYQVAYSTPRPKKETSRAEK